MGQCPPRAHRPRPTTTRPSLPNHGRRSGPGSLSPGTSTGGIREIPSGSHKQGNPAQDPDAFPQPNLPRTPRSSALSRFILRSFRDRGPHTWPPWLVDCFLPQLAWYGVNRFPSALVSPNHSRISKRSALRIRHQDCSPPWMGEAIRWIDGWSYGNEGMVRQDRVGPIRSSIPKDMTESIRPIRTWKPRRWSGHSVEVRIHPKGSSVGTGAPRCGRCAFHRVPLRNTLPR